MKKSFSLILAFLCLAAPAVSGEDKGLPPAAGVEQRARHFVSLLAQQEFQKATADFDGSMKAAAPPDRLKAIWMDLLNTAGAYRETKGARTEPFQQYRFVFVTCRFERRLIDVKVVIDQAGRIAGMFFVPAQPAQYRSPGYANPRLFQERDIVVGAGEWKLPGTLSMPVGKGPFPAVILVHGSGSLAGDRDESIGPNKPFRDLAWGLASQGVCVLRYEKRTKQYAARFAAAIEGLTVNEETIADALAAVSLLLQTEGIDRKKIFVLGHSLGGMLAPRMAAANANISGLIILAAAARPLEDLMLAQTLYQAALAGELPPTERLKVEEIKRQVAAVKNLSPKSLPQGLILGAPASYWLDLRNYSPPAVAKTLKQPMLILQGERDCQVNPREDFGVWREALSGRKNATLKSYPTLNHLFMEVGEKSSGAEYQQAGNVADAVIADIAAWIKRP
jgi:hypothetical protein